MKLKDGVRLRGIRPELTVAIQVAESVYRRVSPSGEFVLTSVCDGQHAAVASLHYAGDAFDLRIHDLPDDATKASLRAELEVALGDDFDVLLENPGTDGEHIHCEYQAKRI